jgi:cell division protein FtsB
MVTDFNKKGNKEFFNKKLLFRTAGILFSIIIAVLLFTDIKIYQKKKELTLQILNYQKQIDEIKKNNQNLKNDIANAGDTDYLEKIAYEQLGQQKPGERQVIFVTPDKKEEAPVQAENFLSPKSWSAWLGNTWQWIKNRF